jgi:hypothetical protein
MSRAVLKPIVVAGSIAAVLAVAPAAGAQVGACPPLLVSGGAGDDTLNGSSAAETLNGLDGTTRSPCCRPTTARMAVRATTT